MIRLFCRHYFYNKIRFCDSRRKALKFLSNLVQSRVNNKLFSQNRCLRDFFQNLRNIYGIKVDSLFQVWLTTSNGYRKEFWRLVCEQIFLKKQWKISVILSKVCVRMYQKKGNLKYDFIFLLQVSHRECKCIHGTYVKSVNLHMSLFNPLF